MGRKVGDWYHYGGAIHIHTTESDGTKELEEVVRLGAEVGLDFMMFSEHMSMKNREAGKEGMYGKTLVVIGYEHQDQKDEHHYLLFEAPQVYSSDLTAAEYVRAGAADGALGIIAHPDEIRNRMAKYPPYPWRDWAIEGYTGIELWNQMSEWMEKLTPFNKLPMSLSPRKSMVGPTDRILKKWDELSACNKCVGIASVDAHAFPVSAGPLKIEIFPYKVHFRCLRTYIVLAEPLADDFKTARAQLYQAIRDCAVFIANVRWGPAEEFGFYAENEQGRVTCGGELTLTKSTCIRVQSPARASLRLIFNGQQIHRQTGKSLKYPVTEPGLYRVEAHKLGRGWIYSNHIRIKP